MQEIRELIQVHDEYLPMILFAVFAMLVITFTVNHFTERIRFPKYIPGLVSFVVGMIILAGLIPHLFEKEYLGNIVMAMVAIGVGIIGLCFGLMLGVLFKKQKYKEVDEEEIIYEEY